MNIPKWRISLSVLGFVALFLFALDSVQARSSVALVSGSPTCADTHGKRICISIRQIDVGQGDAALITTAEGRHILIDAGPDPSYVERLLADEGIDTLDLVIASHNHADHIGGMPKILRCLVVRAYLDNGIPQNTSIYRETLAALEEEPNLQYLDATSRTLILGTTKIRILPPPRFDRTQNDNSVGVVVEYDHFRALFTGDSERAELRFWLQRHMIPTVTYLKASHHGSFNGMTEELGNATSPKIVAMSVGANGFGHPSSRALAYWKHLGARIFRTDESGAIELEAAADGTVAVQTMRLTQPRGQ